MTRIFLYNIGDRDKAAKLRRIALRLGLVCVEVPPEKFSLPLGALLDEEGTPVSDAPAEGFVEEMLVMEELCPPLLDAMRREGATVALKAVVTEQNRTWSAAQLGRELRREHEALRAYAAKKPVHQHKKRK